MEHQLPRANGFAALREVINWIRREKLPVSFPFEYRLVAGDDIWMSPFNAGPCASISMHQYAKMAWRDIFAEAEAIFRDHGGRPHWAKRHTLAFDDGSACTRMPMRFAAPVLLPTRMANSPTRPWPIYSSWGTDRHDCHF